MTSKIMYRDLDNNLMSGRGMFGVMTEPARIPKGSPEGTANFEPKVSLGELEVIFGYLKEQFPGGWMIRDGQLVDHEGQYNRKGGEGIRLGCA